MAEALILDGDFGPDEAWTLAAIAGFDALELIATTVVFGNAGLDRMTENALCLLHFLGFSEVPVITGAGEPESGPLPPGDNAYGADGINGVVLPRPPGTEARPGATGFLARMISAREPAPTLLATGPLTNIARLLAQVAPADLGTLHIMGGCTAPLRLADGGERGGNITPHAEFNFFMDPVAAARVCGSGAAIRLYPLNLTHQLPATPERLAAVAALDPDLGPLAARMMQGAEAINGPRFGLPGILHDVHTALGLVDPDLYEGRQGRLDIVTQGERAGQSLFTPDPAGPVFVAERLGDAEAAFAHVLTALDRCFQRARAAGLTPAHPA